MFALCLKVLSSPFVISAPVTIEAYVTGDMGSFLKARPYPVCANGHSSLAFRTIQYEKQSACDHVKRRAAAEDHAALTRYRLAIANGSHAM
jgi:hypothetical protein